MLGEALGAEVTVPDDELLVRLRPDAVFLGYYRLNGRGWRGPQVPQRGPDGAARVVAFGDSCTFGFGVGEESSWPRQLERMAAVLLAGEPAVEVVNAGVPGYSTWQNRLQLGQDLLALEPDLLVLFTSGHNDITGHKGRTDAEATAHNRSFAAPLQRTRLWRLLSAAPAEDDREVVPPGVPGIGWRVGPAETSLNLDDMARQAAAAGVPLVLVAPVHGAAARQLTAAYDDFARLLVERAGALALPLADPRPEFAARPPDALFVDGLHPDEEGHALVALAVLEALAATPGALGDSPRVAALAGWLAARRLGLPQEPFDSTLLPSLAAAMPRFDPVAGSELPLVREGALRWLAGRAASEAEAATLRARADVLDTWLVPEDAFAVMLAGELRDEGRVDLARALSALFASAGVPLRAHDLRLSAARAALAADDAPGAVELLAEALALQPDDPALLAAMAQACQRAGRKVEAAAHLDQLLARWPDSPAGLTLKARGLLKQERPAEAETALRTAIEARPSFADARYLLGRLLLQRGALGEAEQQLGAARAFGDKLSYPDLLDLLAEIAARRAGGTAPTAGSGLAAPAPGGP